MINSTFDNSPTRDSSFNAALGEGVLQTPQPVLYKPSAMYLQPTSAVVNRVTCDEGCPINNRTRGIAPNGMQSALAVLTKVLGCRSSESETRVKKPMLLLL